MSSYFTELAFRTAANKTKRTLTGEGDTHQVDEFRDTALKRSQELVQGSADGSSISSQMLAQSQAISIAIKGLQLAYSAISKQVDVLSDQRLSFDRERKERIATFTVRTNIEENKLSLEEKAIKGFMELASSKANFLTYLGIHTGEFAALRNVKFYSVLPFYRMSEALDHPVASTKPLDKQRNAINLFLKSALPEAIADIDTGFQTDWGFIAFWTSLFQRKNYLNNRRAPRFIIMSLSNLLWNLQHPVDPTTGFPISISQCIQLCREVELFLNNLLNPESPPDLHAISNEENKLISFLRKLEIHVKGLRAAYQEEQLHEINIDEITNSAHHTLRIMDQSVLKLIYKPYNPVTRKEEPDEKAAENIACTVNYLNLLLARNPQLAALFNAFPEWVPSEAGMNVPPITVMDILIIFCHLPWRERDRLIASLAKSNIASSLEFAQTLRKFDEKFITPVKNISKKELNATIFNPKHRDVCILTARRLIPFLTLVIKDYHVEVDTPATIERVKLAAHTGIVRHSGKQLVQDINMSAERGGEYYYWSLSPFIHTSSAVAKNIDNLPKRQYRMTQVTELLDGVRELVQHYRHFLQNEQFQAFLLKCLNKVKKEYADLDEHIDNVDKNLADDEQINRSLKDTLRGMAKDLNTSLDTFAVALTNLERIVSAPEFTEQQRQILATKLSIISGQFSTLFAEDSGITTLVGAPVIPMAPSSTPRLVASAVPKSSTPKNEMNDIVEARKVIALRKIVQRCYDALSYQSREGHKGLLLRELLAIIEDRPHFTENQIRHVIMELIRVTASYRQTWLFQANYAQTRSARALISAIKDPAVNNVLPLASIIFDQSKMNIMQLSDNQIIQRLKGLREGGKWQESATKMRLTSLS